MDKSLEQLKHIERISRQTRHYRTHLNQTYNEKLRQELNNLTDEYEQTFIRSKTQEKLERQRKEILDISIKQITHRQKSHSLIEQNTIPILRKDNNKYNNLQNRPSTSITQSPTRTSCRLFSHKCQLYPCQPIYHYTSFIKKEHDQTLQERNSSSSYPQNLFLNNQEKTSRLTIHNKNHLANRYIFIKRTMERLNEQSRLLQEQLANQKKFGYIKEHQHDLRQAIQRHLEISAKFCA